MFNRVVICGAAGQLGHELSLVFEAAGCQVLRQVRAQLDLTNAPLVERTLAAFEPELVINSAAYNMVDVAEQEPQAAYQVNALAVRNLAVACRQLDARLVHFSTDYVFDGRKSSPYVEVDAPGPINVYGRSKLAGERAVAAGNRRHIIVRTSWVYSPWRKNFVKTILRLAGERDQLRIVADQRGCPTAACDVAAACLQTAMRCVLDSKRVIFGTYHYAGLGEATWCEFARTIVNLAGNRLARSPEIVAIPTTAHPTLAARPPDTRLDCTAIVQAFGVKLHPWRESLANTIDELLTEKDVA